MDLRKVGSMRVLGADVSSKEGAPRKQLSVLRGRSDFGNSRMSSKGVVSGRHSTFLNFGTSSDQARHGPVGTLILLLIWDASDEIKYVLQI